MSKNIFDDLISFEEGTLDEDAVPGLFQRLIDDGTVWQLQGSYGRTAQGLIEGGQCMLGPSGHRDYWGNYAPSRFEVKPGTPGSPEYVNTCGDEDAGIMLDRGTLVPQLFIFSDCFHDTLNDIIGAGTTLVDCGAFARARLSRERK